MRGPGKRGSAFKGLHCTHCALRFGTAEHYVIRQGKPFHNNCY